MPTKEFYLLFPKVNNEQYFIFDDVVYGKK